MFVLSFVAVLLLSTTFATPAAAQNDTGTKSSALAAFGELKDGWNQLRPGGATICAKGTEYHFYARPGARDKLLVYFRGGGGCWRGEECDRGMPFYEPDLQPEFAESEARRGGILDLSQPENPFTNHSAVIVSYCTGDVHLGDRDVTYTVKSDTGETRPVEIHHRGQVNAMAVLRWVYDNFPAPREIFVSGTSAGAVATPFYASVLARHYPRARVTGLGDDAGSLQRAAIEGVDFGRWGHPDVLRRHAGWKQFPAKWGTEDHYITAARAAPGLRLFQVDHAHDQAQYGYIVLASAPDVESAQQRLRTGAENVDVLALLRSNRREIGRQVDMFRSFTVGGRAHRILQNERFYAYETNGHRLRDWVAAIAAGKPVSSVDCTDCWRSEYRFLEQDVRIVARALELLSPAGAWNPQDRPGNCPQSTDRYSLRCSVMKAVGDVTGRTPINEDPAVVWESSYTALDRMGDRERRSASHPLLIYNNRPGTSVADIVGLLGEVRDRIHADVRRRQKQ